MKIIPWPYFILVLILLGLIIFGVTTSQNNLRPQEATDLYQKGELTTTIAERKAAFNSALDIYLTLEKEYHPRFGTGKLYYDIGNTYYNLESYPWAILYYNRAQRLMPRSDEVVYNLATTLKQLQLPQDNPPDVFSKVLSLQTYLSLPEQLQLFCGLTILAFLFASFYIWTNNQWCKKSVFICFIPIIWLLLGFAYTHYFTPLEAILVQSVELRRDAGRQYAKVNIDPIPAGSKVEVIDITSDGSWLKIKMPQESLGFVPQESIRLIE